MDASSLRSLSSILSKQKETVAAGNAARVLEAEQLLQQEPPSGYTVDADDPDSDSTEFENSFSEHGGEHESGSIANAAELRPPTPETIEHTGLTVKLIEQLIVKLIYYRGEIVGRELSSELGLQFSVIEHVVDGLKRNHYVIVKSSLGVGMVSSRFELSDSGRELAREYIDSNAYAGKAPVPLFQYVDIVRRQKARDSWLNMGMLKDCYKHMVVTDQILNQIGPAVNAGKSFLIYGMPGNGKTYLAEALMSGIGPNVHGAQLPGR